jgi:hypothetical protein
MNMKKAEYFTASPTSLQHWYLMYVLVRKHYPYVHALALFLGWYPCGFIFLVVSVIAL